jgi:putative endonuclease
MSPSSKKVNQQWWVYMVETKSGKLYTGITTDPERRFNEHQNDAKLGARFFRSDPAKAMVYKEQQDDRSCATKREAAIKKLPRKAKLALIG